MADNTTETRKLRLSGLAVALAALAAPLSVAQNPLSVSSPEKDNSVAAEQQSFALEEGYEINLFADETDGVANPVCMSWDPAGRLWVLCTWVYPQAKPVEQAKDKLLILADTDGDGRADETTVFADGLNMPTGFALGHGGVYVGQGNDLLHLRDTDGDGKADATRVVLTGFGTGDTHQNINSLTWSPGGELLFCQGLHSFSRVETPWGISRLDEHGTWRLRPKRLQLHGFRRTGGGGNPWGIAFGRWGEPFAKSNGPGISELVPNMVHVDRYASFWGREMEIGQTRIKSMIIEFAESPHLPDDIQGEMLIAGYFARDINRLQMSVDGSGHRLTRRPPLLRSSHNAFRPVDIRIGPDGAIYIADWFNPIIGHYQASFRHPDRDKTHGRIWRVTATGRPLAKAPVLANASATTLCKQLESDWRYIRYQAKRRLADLPKGEVIPAITGWIEDLDPDHPDLEHHLYEALGVFESHEVVNRALLERVLASRDHRARAYAARVVGRWHDRLDAPLRLLDKAVGDEHARVRLEALVACSDVRTPAAMVVAAKASRHRMDRFVTHALTQTAHALAPGWLPALEAGEIRFHQPADLIEVLRAYGGKDVAGQIRRLLKSDATSADGRARLLELLARVGGTADLRTVFDHALADPALLQSLTAIVAQRRIRPDGDVHAALRALLSRDDPEVRASAVRLAGLWKQQRLVSTVKEFLVRDQEPDVVRAAAIHSLGELDPGSSVAAIRKLIDSKQGATVYVAALEALGRIDVRAAADDGLALLTSIDAPSFGPVLSTIMQRRGGAAALVGAIGTSGITKDNAKLISRWLSASGRDDVGLINALTRAMGINPSQETPFSADFVRELAVEVRAAGNPAKGRTVFQSSLASCTACHQVQGLGEPTSGFRKGPDLTAVGAGLPLDAIIEAVVWPQRQIKEGYETLTLFTDDGDVVSGYLTGEEGGVVRIRDLATGKILEIPTDGITDRLGKTTAMPSGFTNTLTRAELRDLIAFLSTLTGSKVR